MGKRKQTYQHPLQYLSIRWEFPKPLASYGPAIEDEFLLNVDWKEKLRSDEKLQKRKAKKVEKDAIRELKKDTETIQE